jgi:hypothetical protein
MILVIVMLIVIFTLRALEQAVTWAKQGAEAFKWNEHILFMISRAALFFSMIACSYLEMKDVAIGIGCFLPMFFFVHNGVYYEARKHIDGSYPLGFFDKSTTSTAWMPTLGIAARSGLFLLGLIGAVVIQLV